MRKNLAAYSLPKSLEIEKFPILSSVKEENMRLKNFLTNLSL
jgi:hypothetical protein